MAVPPSREDMTEDSTVTASAACSGATETFMVKSSSPSDLTLVIWLKDTPVDGIPCSLRAMHILSLAMIPSSATNIS